jgi:hypothetical protein
MRSASEEKKYITELFKKNVKGRRPPPPRHSLHDGFVGYWLEKRMRVFHNGKASSDFPNYEMKSGTPWKTTLGDWSADFYIWQDPRRQITRTQFMKVFGKYNREKSRYSWSGQPVPKIGKSNEYGQRLRVEPDGSIVALYSHSKDTRSQKTKIVPKSLRRENLVLAKWNASSLKKRLSEKFGRAGWFRCLRDRAGFYCKIVFGPPLRYKAWLQAVRENIVFLDSGMHQGNSRNYSSWRARNTYWEALESTR